MFGVTHGIRVAFSRRDERRAHQPAKLAFGPLAIAAVGCRQKFCSSANRDYTGRIVSAWGNATGTGTGDYYGYTSDTDSPSMIYDATATTLTDTILSLPGGITLTRKPGNTAATTWVYRNFNGDTESPRG